jgi:hypothetical protein
MDLRQKAAIIVPDPARRQTRDMSDGFEQPFLVDVSMPLPFLLERTASVPQPAFRER